MSELDIIRAGPEHAAMIVEVIHRAFAARPVLDPASTALDETPESVARTLAGPGGLVVLRRGVPMGAMLFDDSRPGKLGFTRVSVDPQVRDRGVASAMVGVAEDIAEERGLDGIWLHARAELPENLRFWTHRHYVEVGREGTRIDLGKTLWLAREIPDAEAMAEFASRVASLVSAGDLLVLTGGLGAGKTTFTQGLGEALGVRGPITSPTFVLARTHPSLVGGPALVHVDAYRLGDAAELDDIDLDTTFDQAVTVVEWGAGRAEQLSDSRLDITIEVREATDADPSGARCGVASDDMRVISVKPRGPRWIDVPLRSVLLA